MMKVDDVFAEIGELGGQQWKYVLCVALIHMYFPSIMLQYTFAGKSLDFQCFQADNASTLYNSCPDKTATLCTGLAFPENETSVVSEWGLICDRSWLSALTMSSFMGGVLAGAIVFGAVSDSFGRQLTMFATLGGMIVANGGLIVTKSYILYCVLRFISGIFCGGFIIAMSVLTNEYIGSKKRGLAAAIISSTWSLGLALLALGAYSFRSWRELTLIITAVGTPLLLFYFYLPESPHWLVAKGRKDEAVEVLQDIALGNGSILQDKWDYDTPKDSRVSNAESICSFFQHKSLAVITLIQLYSWFATSSSYYGLTLAAGTLGGDLYTATALSGLVEIPGAFLATFTLARYGRIKSLCGFLFACSGSLFGILACQQFAPFLITSLGLFGKLCISTVFTIIYIHSAEIFPTTVRNRGMGMVAVASRLGGIISPYLAKLGEYFPHIPNLHILVFAVLCLMSGILNLKLPETLGEPLPETVENLRQRLESPASKGKAGVRDSLTYSALVDDDWNEDDEFEDLDLDSVGS